MKLVASPAGRKIVTVTNSLGLESLTMSRMSIPISPLQATRRFDRDLAGAPPSIQQAFESALLLSNPRHPTLRAKNYDEARGIWQARVTSDWRFYFTIEAGAYMLRTIRSHPK